MNHFSDDPLLPRYRSFYSSASPTQSGGTSRGARFPKRERYGGKNLATQKVVIRVTRPAKYPPIRCRTFFRSTCRTRNIPWRPLIYLPRTIDTISVPDVRSRERERRKVSEQIRAPLFHRELIEYSFRLGRAAAFLWRTRNFSIRDDVKDHPGKRERKREEDRVIDGGAYTQDVNYFAPTICIALSFMKIWQFFLSKNA